MIALFCIGFCALGAQTLYEVKSGGARISFAQSEYDFGAIKEDGGVVRHDFEFTNSGDAPLVIVRVVTSCTCTKAEFSKKPIAPGQKSSIKIAYDPKKQSGVFYKAIQVFSNGVDNRVVITTKGEVKK